MAAMQAAPVGSWGGGSFLPLHKPILQVPYPRSRSIRLGGGMTDNLPQIDQRFTKEQLQHLFQHFPASFASITQAQNPPKPKPTFTTTTSTTTTTTTTTTTAKPQILSRNPRPQQRKGVPKFYYGGIEGREDYAVGPAEDDAVVLLVGLFNLLAIVVYAASKFVMGDPGGLSNRVIQWQVQKVLDELVIKVHSSQYVANLLSRAMPPEGVIFEEGRRINDQSKPTWIDVLQQRIQIAYEQNSTSETTEWLSKVKDRLITEIGSSPAAVSAVRLHPRIYRPLKKMYRTLTSENGFKHLLDNVISSSETGRSIANMKDIPGVLNTLSRLSLDQIQSLLATMTALGRAQQRVNIIPMLINLMGSQSEIKEDNSNTLVETGRVIAEGDSFAETLAQYVYQSYSQPKPSRQGHNLGYNTRYSRLIDTDTDDIEDKMSETQHTLSRQKVNRPMRRRPSQLVRRQGVVEDEDSTPPTGHWTDRWFSLVTQLSPVGLDMTTLYARARSKPDCLRALLCRANNAWRQVGPVPAAFTPFTSVLVSWLLEDTTPHSLGDSLIAVRAGWMGKDCSILYPECPLQPDPHPAAKEAITFFSRLQFAATAPPNMNKGASSSLSVNSEVPLGNSGTRPENNQHSLMDRIDSQPISNEQFQGSGLRPPYTMVQNAYRSSTPKPQYHETQEQNDNPGMKNSRPPHNYRIPDNEQSPYPKRKTLDNKPSSFPNSRNPVRDENNAAEVQAYYNRYGGQGPMAVPGSQYSSKYGHIDGNIEQSQNKMKNLYEKYDSPTSNSAEGEISGSNSVAGMALQDRPTGTNAKVWEEFFKAGLYGGVVPQSSQNKKDESPNTSPPEKSIQVRKPMKRPAVSSLNKMGALLPDQPGFFANPGYSKLPNTNRNIQKPNKPNRVARPYFTLRPKRPQPTGLPSNRAPASSSTPFVKKYKYGLRRGLPASNVNGYNAYIGGSSNGNLHQRQKPWYAYINNNRFRPTPKIPSTPKPVITTTTVSTTEHPLASKDVAPFGPEDAVTDVLRNELLYEYIRDRQGSIPIDDRKRSLS